jgi:hypothetical protein
MIEKEYWMSVDIINAAIARVRLSRLAYKNANRGVIILKHAMDYIYLLWACGLE